jgi:hypothetical protein
MVVHGYSLFKLIFKNMAKFQEIIIRSINTSDGTYVNSDGETKSILPLEIYLVPKSDGTHTRIVIDENGISSTQAGLGDYIPLSGTLTGKPITGDIQSTKDILFNPTSDRPAKLKHFPAPIYSVSFGDMNPLTTGNQSNGFGIGALRAQTTGSYNNAFGCISLVALTAGNYNSAFGDFTLGALTTGNYNSAFGAYSGNALTTGGENTFIGLSSATTATTGNGNTVVGSSSGRHLTDGFKNVIIGTNCSYNKNTNLNTVIGYKAGLFTGNTSGHDRNILIGAFSANNMAGQNSIMIGNGAGHDETNSNRLVIHNSRLTGYSNTTEGNYQDANEGKYEYGLITGDFVTRVLTFNTNSLSIRQAGNANTAITITPNSGAGITSAIQHVPIDSKDFVQKKYVDDKWQEFTLSDPTTDIAPVALHVDITNITTGADATANVTTALRPMQRFTLINYGDGMLQFQVSGASIGGSIAPYTKREYIVTQNGTGLVSSDQGLTIYN